MQISIWSIVVIIEVVFVLILSTGYLSMRNRQLKNTIDKLKERIANAVGAKTNNKVASDASKTYSEYVEEQINLTKQHHEALTPDQDISLDLGLDNPLPRQIVSLRHAFLTCEKQALIQGESHKPNWSFIQEKLSQLIDFYTEARTLSEGLDDEIDDEKELLKQRIVNLEKFKTLYFDLEKKWEEAQKQADDCLEELTEYANDQDDEALSSLVDRYQSSYEGFNDVMQTLSDKPEKNKQSVIEIVRSDPKSTAEIKQLKGIAIDQQRVINELQKKLNEDSNHSELTASLSEQLEQQGRFIKEAESCISLLENELNTAQSALENNVVAIERGEKAKEALAQYARDNKRLQDTIDKLTKENIKMDKALNSSGSSVVASSEEFKELQQQYNELEDKYLELKMK